MKTLYFCPLGGSRILKMPQTHLNPTKLKNKQPGYLKMSDSECVAKTSSHLRRRRALTEAERKNTVYSLYNGRKLFL